MKIDCISDLHGYLPQLPGGDLLILAGDYTGRDTLPEYALFYQWLQNAKYARKIVVAGNHDNHLDPAMIDCIPNTTYLQDSRVEYEGLNIWGSPWTRTFAGMNPHCTAYTLDTEEELAEKWALIPEDTHILVTHGPAYGNRDYTRDFKNMKGTHVGSTSLLTRVESLEQLKIFVFGHIHETYGHTIHLDTGLHSINASHVNGRYRNVNPAIEYYL